MELRPRSGAPGMVAVRGNHPRENETQHATNQDSGERGHNAFSVQGEEHSPEPTWPLLEAGAQLPTRPPWPSLAASARGQQESRRTNDVQENTSIQAAGRTPQARNPTFRRAPTSDTSRAQVEHEGSSGASPEAQEEVQLSWRHADFGREYEVSPTAYERSQPTAAAETADQGVNDPNGEHGPTREHASAAPDGELARMRELERMMDNLNRQLEQERQLRGVQSRTMSRAQEQMQRFIELQAESQERASREAAEWRAATAAAAESAAPKVREMTDAQLKVIAVPIADTA